MSGCVVGLIVYAAIGAAVVAVGELSVPHDEPATPLGVVLIGGLWPVFLLVVAWQWWSLRRDRRH